MEIDISAMGAQTEVQTADQHVGAGGQVYNPLNPRSGNRYSRQAGGSTIFSLFAPPPFFPPDLFFLSKIRRLFDPTSTFFRFIVYLAMA